MLLNSNDFRLFLFNKHHASVYQNIRNFWTYICNLSIGVFAVEKDYEKSIFHSDFLAQTLLFFSILLFSYSK